MRRSLKFILFIFLVLPFFIQHAFAGVEPYENFIKGKIKRRDTLIVKDEKFKNAKYNWDDITNISVKNAVSFRLIDESLLTADFSASVNLKVEYRSSPGQASPTVKNIELKLNYSRKKGVNYRINNTYTFAGAYWIKVTVENISSPEYGNDLPPNFQLTANIIIDRQYKFKPQTPIRASASFTGGTTQTTKTAAAPRANLLASTRSSMLMNSITGGTTLNSGNQLQLTWAVITGAEEYDIEWTTADAGNDHIDLIRQMANGTAGTADPVELNKIFLNNATRITTASQSYLLSLVFNDDYILVRMRQVQYSTDGVRLLGDWDYQLGSGQYAVWSLNWYQQNLNWQYAAAFAEDGKKKEVVSYFDGSLRSRQTVTLNNSDNVAVVQESLYDEFGRPTASILPAPFKEADGATPYLHYFANYNLNSNSLPYNFDNIKGSIPAASCEYNPDPLGTTAGASKYYSASNPFKNDKTYDNFIPDAEGFPLSVSEYTADNTGRLKVQGGVGKIFQPGRTYPSKTTKYYYAKPDQWELDRIFGNDVGNASHYLKNMVADPNGQISVSYVNASGKTVATALSGLVPAGVDSISTILPTKIQTISLLDTDKFIFDQAALKIKATTTHLVSMAGPAKLAYHIQKLVDTYPGGAQAICSNCYYDLTIKVLNDCNTPIYTTTTPIQLGAKTGNCNGAGTQADSLQVNFPQIGEYYFTFELAFSKTVMENYVDQFVIQGQQNGFLRKEFSFITPYLEALDYKSCLSDCQTCEQSLGARADFITAFNKKLIRLDVDSVSVMGAAFQTWVDNKYTSLKAYCDSLSATCVTQAASYCDRYEKPMLDDVSPGGQYALFDTALNPVEPAINVISNNWRTEFPVETSGQADYQATPVTLPDGSITSPYDQNFTLAMLVTYWKADWATKFLKYHPEYCKLTFCTITSAYKTWDQNVQDNYDSAAAISTIPGAPAGLHYDYTDAAFLAAADPYFQDGAPGAVYRTAMQNDLRNFTLNYLKVTQASTKSLTAFIDFLTYCADPSSNVNTLNNSYNNWDNCSPGADCRVPDREWDSYKTFYFQLKQDYYDKVMASTTCPNTCPVGTPTAMPASNPCPVPTDFTITDLSAADGTPTVQCTSPQKTVTLTYNPGKVGTAATVTIAYPAGFDATGLPTVFSFAAGDVNKTFCIPESLPANSLSVQSVECSACQANPLLFTVWTNDHIVQNVYDSSNHIVSTTNFIPACPFYTTGTLTISPDNTYAIAGVCNPSTGAWNMDRDCLFALYSNDIKYSLDSVDAQHLVLKHREGMLEEIWYLNGGGNTIVCSNPTTLEVASVAGSNRYFTGSYPNRHVLGVVHGTSDTPPAYDCINSLNQASNPTPVFYPCLTIHTTANTSANYSNVWVFDCLYDNVPTNCPQVLLTKQSRFIAIDKTMPPENTASLVEDNKEQLQAQIQTSADAAGDNWIADLTPGLNDYQAKIPQLRAALVEIAAKGGDIDHPFGASSVAPGQTTASGYLNFTDAIRGILGLSHFTSQLNPWLISSPYPFAPKMQAFNNYIVNSDPDLCALLQENQTQCDAYNSAHGTSLNLYNYFLLLYGSAMTLDPDDFTVLQNSCGQCKFILAHDLSLPVFLDPKAKGCILPAEYATAKTDLNNQFDGTLATDDPNYETIFANFMNQRWGFVLGFAQYAAYDAQLAANPSALLCNTINNTVTPDPLACIESQMAGSVANGKREYATYLDDQKNLFRASYISKCSAAQGHVNLYAPEKIYHYTLYYYDRADNLIGTVPPEGVALMTDAQVAAAKTYRDYYAASDTLDKYDALQVKMDTIAALTSLSATLASTRPGQAIEMWLYNTAGGTEQVLATGADRNYLFQTCISGSQMNLDVYTLAHSDTTAVTIATEKHFTYNLAGSPPLQTWQHIVLQGTNFLTDTINAFVNGVSVPLTTYNPAPGCGFTIPGGINPPAMPLNLNFVKHLRFYNRLLPQLEISVNAASAYFLPANSTGMTWYRFNVPVAGSSNTVDAGSTDEMRYQPVYPGHRMFTTYAYNSTNQVTQQQSPDGGVNRFWYDLLSRLVISQNDKQLATHDYSYTNFDILGRITEVGQKNQTTININNPDYLADAAIASFNAAGTNSQITNTYYDAAAPASNGIQSVTQNNLRKRVAASTFRDTQAGQVQQATYYNYDLDGDVKNLYQQIAGLGLKRMDYEYDLVSGKVNFVSYQDGQPDQFYYKYNYDADNRITEAWTGTQATIKPGGGSYLLNGKMDASYQYYLHGPLARQELGDVYGKVQGIDHAYTLQGWLKGVNRQSISSSSLNDIGQDGISSNAIARDVFGYSLGYYHDDYKPIGGASYTAFSAQYQQAAADSTGQDLYNGNISTMVTSVSGVPSPFGTTYRYDQLNRLKMMRSHNHLNLSSWSNSTITRGYQETLAYDGNGNIRTYIKNSPNPAGGNPVTNAPVYTYEKMGSGPTAKVINNRLRLITDPYGTDPVTGAPGPQDISTSYTYDPIGNLTGDTKAGITNIDWTVYGKIKAITKSSGNLDYTYDPAGQRATKSSGSIKTWYVRDASGNTMAVYDNKGGTTNWREQDLYGSSRLGVWTPNVNLANNNASTVWDTIGHKQYELTNHLGNVLATITDKRLAISGPNNTIAYYQADLATAQLYYSFGAIMPYMNSSVGTYRYGFNGKENDNEVKQDANGNNIAGAEQDYGMRIYDPRVGRFLSVDPLTVSYPWYTPYQFAGNSPIANIDMDGGEPKPVNRGTTEGQATTTYDTKYSAGGEAYPVSQTWKWYSGNIKGHGPAGWFTEDQYKLIRQDWEHGQVMLPFEKSTFGDDPYSPSGEIQHPGYGRNWNGYQVGKGGYLTGKKYEGSTSIFAGFNLFEWIDGAGELRVLGALSEGRALLKEGEYMIYFGVREGKPYIGSTTELLERYSQGKIDEMMARAFDFFAKNPDIRIPNRGIAIGFEQLVIRLNNAGENISKANQGVHLSNKINAAVKEIYVSEAVKWATKNIPDWQNLFKIK